MADNGSSATPDKDQKKGSLLKDPIVITAVFGATIAAIVNAWVAWSNNTTTMDVETHKEGEEQLIEARKAEFSRVLEISKLDADGARKKIKAFCEMQIIRDPAICSSSALLSQTASNQPRTQITWSSGWLGGGHNQPEVCSTGAVALSEDPKYKGKPITFISASEDSRRDFFGHVEYNYHCNYEVILR